MTTMTLRDGEKSMILRNGVWIMTYRTSNEYTLESTLSMYGSTWQVVKIVPPKEGNVYTYTLDEIQDKDNAVPT